jgi:ferredoxin
MRRVILAEEKLGDLIRRWGAERRVVAPVRRGAVEFEPIASADAICTDYRNTRLPAKRLFFQPSEALLRFDFKAAAEQQVAECPADMHPTVLFGVRPCEARSLTLLDRVFLGKDYRDPYYASRRKATAIVVLACSSFAPSCFCTSVGGGPADRTGADLFLWDDSAAFVVDVVTDRGEALLADLALPDANAETLERIDGAAAEVAAAMHGVAGLDQIGPEATDAFDDPCWQTIGERCLACAACSFLCPTCHCFDIQDEVFGETGRRVRNYDACTFPLFTLHASGHNPRPDKLQRLRQRLLHKFAYFPENFGALACVGCGRCIRACPAGNDIRQWLRSLIGVCAQRTGKQRE